MRSKLLQLALLGVLLATTGGAEVAHLKSELLGDKPGTEEWSSNFQGCSLACGLPWKTQASSHLPSQGSNSYGAEMSVDGKHSTAWVEGVAGDGVGEWLECTFHRDSHEPINFNGVAIAAGYQKSDVAFRENARPKQLRMLVNGEDWAYLDLQDTPKIQSFQLAHRFLKSGDKLRLIITQVYPGSRYQDTAITDFVFFGGH